MARLRMLFLVVLAALALVAPVAVLAQQYTVKEGDTLWSLSAEHLKDPLKWGQVVGRNPFLKEPGRLFIKGDRVIVLIRPSEKLEGLATITGETPKPVPISELGPAKAPVASVPSWVLGLLPILILALIVLTLLAGTIHLRLRRARGKAEMARAEADHARALERVAWDQVAAIQAERAATAGAQQLPIVPGGIPPELPVEVLGRFERIAESEMSRRDPTGRFGAVRPQVLRPIQHVRLTSSTPQPVRYADGAVVPTTLNQTPAYHARVQYPGNAEPRDEYFLQICGNDLVHGGLRMEGVDVEVISPDVVPAVPPTAAGPTTPASAVAPDPSATVTLPIAMRVRMELRDGQVVLVPAGFIEMSSVSGQSAQRSLRRRAQRPASAEGAGRTGG